MRQGARKENIGKQSLTDEQRRRIAKGPQPFGLEQSGRLAFLFLGRVGTRTMLPRRASPASQTISSAGHSYLLDGF